ncbi:hypothetical protein HPB48_005406 [Haemaphysalis longicornis]|uniref:Serine/threonine-protein phosphatase 4 regulatory subunit 1 n=1 Tax=Haemaphysalis longicornis TaxID=44386 RepID=A0A9J6GH84_HAELO|nr:hypothetical protein HPB48_005406 [Haemaphysalis longicornis]
MPDVGDSLASDQRGSSLGEAHSTTTVNRKNEELNRDVPYSLDEWTEEQETEGAAADDPLGGPCGDEEDLATRRRQELLDDANPVLKLQRYAHTDVLSDRQLAAKNIVDTLRVVKNHQDDVDAVLSVLASLSRDCEPRVRLELTEQLPDIAIFCASAAGTVGNAVNDHVVPIIIQCLIDDSMQVRESTRASLLFILERALIDPKQLEGRICRFVVRLTENKQGHERRLETVPLMTKIAPFLGQDATAALFLPSFVRLCQDSSCHIRKSCASHFGEFFDVLGHVRIQENLGVFQRLCEDSGWVVRKACADAFMSVSCVCSLATRRSSLAPIFLALLDDQSRWVRIAAFHILGPFIFTFADPERTGLYCSPNGVIRVRSSANSDEDAEENDPSASAFAASLPAVVQRGPEKTTTTLTQTAPQCYNPQTHIEEAPSVRREVDLHSQGEQQDVCEDEEGEPCTDNSGLAVVDDGHEDPAPHQPDNPEDCADSPSRPADQLVAGNERPLENISGKLEDPGDGTDIQECFSVEGDKQQIVLEADYSQDSNFNTFQFWRVPIPEVEMNMLFLGNRVKTQDRDILCFSSDLNLELLPPGNDYITAATNLSDSVTSQPNSGIATQRLTVDTSTLGIQTASLPSLSSYDHECNVSPSSAIIEVPVTLDEAGEMEGAHNVQNSEMSEMNTSESSVSWESLNSSPKHWSPHDQDIVPVPLLERYQTMTDPSLFVEVDSEMRQRCAHCLPAVALTLGRRFWPCLRTTYQSLVSDERWKVRHIVASCLHELATMLGPQIASQDLVPSFEAFVRDVDEVRVGLLKRLGRLLRSLSKRDQRRSLPLLEGFLCTERRGNWRDRHILSGQLCELAELYDPEDINQYLVPIASQLLLDQSAEVRHKSIESVCVLLCRMASQPLLREKLVRDLCAKAHDHKWAQRQLFCWLVEEMAFQGSMTCDEFVGIALPKLLELREDPVPNVRRAVAHCLSTIICRKGQMWSIDVLYQDQVKIALALLKDDADRDVRDCARLPSTEDPKPVERTDIETEWTMLHHAASRSHPD